MHYDAASNDVTSLNAGWNTIVGEDDPMSIPGKLNPAADGVTNMMLEGEPSGRTAQPPMTSPLISSRSALRDVTRITCARVLSATRRGP